MRKHKGGKEAGKHKGTNRVVIFGLLAHEAAKINVFLDMTLDMFNGSLSLDGTQKDKHCSISFVWLEVPI